jgi:hypothetical protein
MGITSGTTLDFDSINRSANRASAAFRVNGLGSSSTVTFSNGTASLKGGIIPWAYANAGDPIVTNPEGEENTLATYGANGVTPVTTLETNQANWNAGVNALITDGGATVNSSVNVNALVLRTSNFYFGSPMTTSGTGTINLTTGVILSGNAGFDAGGLINSSPGNVVDVNINAGTNELIIHTPSAVTFNGVIAGTGGLTKTGGRTGFFNGDSTYTGTTILSGFVRFNDDVIAGVPGPFGTDASNIILDGGVFAPTNPAGAANGTMVGILALDNNSGAATFSRGLTVRGVSNLLRNFSNDVLTMSGPIVLEDPNADLTIQAFGAGGAGVDQFVISGVISGPGHLSATNTASGGATPQFLRLTNANTFTGGFDIGGRVEVGNNNALGAGSVTMAEDTTLEAFGAARTIPNEFVMYSGALSTTGSNTFTFGGTLESRGGAFAFNVDAPTVVSGQLAGGSLFKAGSQTLTLSGSSPDWGGQLNVGNGETPGNFVVIANAGAVGNTALATAANFGENTALLSPGINITTNESFISRGEGVGALGSLRSQSGSGTWGGSFFVQEQTNAGGTPLTTKGSVGVDSGDLTIRGSVFTLGTNGAGQPAQPLGFRKVGAGQLNVGSAEFTSGTSTFQGSVVTTGSFEITQGTVRMLPNAGAPAAKSVADVASISIAGGPAAPTAKLDLTNNAMVVDYASAAPSPLQDIRSYIIAGYAGGAWSGNGITTSNGNAQNFGLGYADNNGTASGTNFTTFLGDPVDNSAVLVRFTRYGDANIDGTVNLADFNRLAANFGLAAGAVWGQGDFTYDGVVNLSDFNRLAANFGLSAGPDGVVDPEDWAALASAIPEPGTLSLVAVAGLGLLKRRRRNSR